MAYERPDDWKRDPCSTEMIPDRVRAYYKTMGPNTFNRPVMLTFGMSDHPAFRHYSPFDIMLTWEQIEELEAAIENVRKQCLAERESASEAGCGND